MKGSENFTRAIQAHLDQLAAADPVFAETLKKPGKNITDCVTYILNQVKKSGVNGMEDEEVYGMAIHYYDEDNIEVGKPISGRVVVNHSLPPDPATPSPAPSAAKPTKKKPEKVSQPSLF